MEKPAIEQLCSEGMKSAKAFRLGHSLALSECLIDEHFHPVQDAYEHNDGYARDESQCHHASPHFDVWSTLGTVWEAIPHTYSNSLPSL